MAAGNQGAAETDGGGLLQELRNAAVQIQEVIDRLQDMVSMLGVSGSGSTSQDRPQEQEREQSKSNESAPVDAVSTGAVPTDAGPQPADGGDGSGPSQGGQPEGDGQQDISAELADQLRNIVEQIQEAQGGGSS